MPFPLTQISNDYCLSNFYYITNIFDIHIFDNETAAFFFFFLKFARICTLIFLNEKAIITFLLMMHLKCNGVHYVNLNASSKNKPFLNYWSLNMLFCFFFRFLICVYFNEAFVKKILKFIFISRFITLHNIWMSNLVILKCDTKNVREHPWWY